MDWCGPAIAAGVYVATLYSITPASLKYCFKIVLSDYAEFRISYIFIALIACPFAGRFVLVLAP